MDERLAGMDPDHHLSMAKRHLNEYASKTGDENGFDVAEDVERIMMGEGVPKPDGGTAGMSAPSDASGVIEPREGQWLRDVQRRTAEWREETINGDPTPLSQAAHTAVEAGEFLDYPVKGETYHEGETDLFYDQNRRSIMAEAGDVIVAHIGTLSLLGLDAVECINVALEKNGAREWDGWQEGGE